MLYFRTFFSHPMCCRCVPSDRVVAFERGSYLFVFNFHPHQVSFFDLALLNIHSPNHSSNIHSPRDLVSIQSLFIHIPFFIQFFFCQSFEGYQIGHSLGSDLRVIIDTDDVKFGGFGRLTSGHHVPFPTLEAFDNRQFSVKLYLPSRTGMVSHSHLLSSFCMLLLSSVGSSS